MSRTKIEWVKNTDGTQGYTINPVKGLCPVGCSYCYARATYKRFKWNPEIRADWQETGKLPNKPSRIFVGSTMELFGDWVKPEWMREILSMPTRYPQHTFIFLTKQPQNLYKWDFPDNCWVGASVTKQLHNAVGGLCYHKAKTKFISFEPLLERLPSDIYYSINKWCSWVICGQQTPVSKKTQPKIEWIKEIVDAADKAGLPVFLKDNLRSLLCDALALQKISRPQFFNGNELRQEFPE